MKIYISLNSTPQEKTALLEASSWANDLNSFQTSVLADYFKCYRIPADTDLILEGEVNNFLGLICEGEVEIIKENSSGRRIALQKLGPGKTVGEISFFDRGPSSASVVAKTQVVLLVLDRVSFDKLCDEAPAVAIVTILNIIPTLCQRLRQTTGRLIDILKDV